MACVRRYVRANLRAKARKRNRNLGLAQAARSCRRGRALRRPLARLPGGPPGFPSAKAAGRARPDSRSKFCQRRRPKPADQREVACHVELANVRDAALLLAQGSVTSGSPRASARRLRGGDTRAGAARPAGSRHAPSAAGSADPASSSAGTVIGVFTGNSSARSPRPFRWASRTPRQI